MGLMARAQPDSLAPDSMWVLLDTLPPAKFRLQTLSASWMDGNVQFFEGYSQPILYADAQSGLPIYSDWIAYQRANSILPAYFQLSGSISLLDSVRGIKLRLSASYSHREDSMAYGSQFTINDTIYGRLASEKGSFGSVSVAGIKQSRKIFNCIRFHGGAEVEVGLSPVSRIEFAEYSSDLGAGLIVDYNEFRSVGKPRFMVMANAILGLETVFFKHFGFTVEVKSGLGAQLVVKEKAFGQARTAYHLGINYYLWDYNRKALPKMVPTRQPIPGAPPTPEF
jgi:hypothetical protein